MSDVDWKFIQQNPVWLIKRHENADDAEWSESTIAIAFKGVGLRLKGIFKPYAN